MRELHIASDAIQGTEILRSGHKSRLRILAVVTLAVMGLSCSCSGPGTDLDGGTDVAEDGDSDTADAVVDSSPDSGCTSSQDPPLDVTGTINEATVWTNICAREDQPDYRVTGELLVAAPLEIHPDVAVEFGSAAGLVVMENGSIQAVGKPDARIVLTGTSAAPGSWRGVTVASASDDNVLDHVVLSAAGQNPTDLNPFTAASVALVSDGRLTLSHVQIRNGAGVGLLLDSTHLLGIENSTITSHERVPVMTRPGAIAALSANQGEAANAFRGNDDDVIDVYAGTFDSGSINLGFGKMDVPYRIGPNALGISEVLEISNQTTVGLVAGVELRMEEHTAIVVSDKSSFVPACTADTPCVLRGTEEAPGHWKALVLNTSKNQLFNHLVIRHAGGGELPDYNVTGARASLFVGSDAHLFSESSTITDGAGHGIYVFEGGSVDLSGENTFSDLDGEDIVTE